MWLFPWKKWYILIQAILDFLFLRLGLTPFVRETSGTGLYRRILISLAKVRRLRVAIRAIYGVHVSYKRLDGDENADLRIQCLASRLQSHRRSICRRKISDPSIYHAPVLWKKGMRHAMKEFARHF